MNIEIVEFINNTVAADTINFMEYLEKYMYKNHLSVIELEDLSKIYNKWINK